MRRKSKWAVTPLYLIFSVALICFAAFSLRFNKVLFYVELMASIAVIIICVISMLFMKKYISGVAKGAAKGLFGEERQFLDGFPFPVAVTGEDGEILWINDRFLKEISIDHTPHGEYISNYLNGSQVSEVLEKSLDIAILEKNYTVYASRSKGSTVFYFTDDTELKQIAEKYRNSRPCVVSVVFDNREEFEREEDSDSLNSVIAPLENTLIKWANTYNGTFRNISNGKYLIVFEESSFVKIEKTKFDILDEIRKIKSSNGTVATISIGVGIGDDNFKNCDIRSKKALEMALGRGGDQAVIKNENDFRFYGGISQGSELRNKVRSRVYASALADKIKVSDKVYIMGHNYSDFDCIGAAAGLYAVVTKMNKYAGIVVKSYQSPALPLIKSLENSVTPDMFVDPSDAVKNISDKSLLIIVDTHASGFLESAELYLKAKNVVVIDHHRMMVNHIANAEIFYQQTFSSSASEMVAELVQYMDDSAINKPIAEALLSGIMLDTKGFTVKAGSRTFEASAYLSSKSADMIAVKQLFANSLEDYKSKCELVFNSELCFNSAIATTAKSAKNIRVIAAQAADELLGIKNVDASYVIFPIEDGVNISARSLGKVNVQLVMESLGGGGHHTMAAVQLKGVSVEQAREMLLEKLDEKTYNT
ncbi:MAG: DHH family phosphoesterase [Clostridia bacterium]|nr:DHH family phosphoesterase [Clostridia bacterium]